MSLSESLSLSLYVIVHHSQSPFLSLLNRDIHYQILSLFLSHSLNLEVSLSHTNKHRFYLVSPSLTLELSLLESHIPYQILYISLSHTHIHSQHTHS